MGEVVPCLLMLITKKLVYNEHVLKVNYLRGGGGGGGAMPPGAVELYVKFSMRCLTEVKKTYEVEVGVEAVLLQVLIINTLV